MHGIQPGEGRGQTSGRAGMIRRVSSSVLMGALLALPSQALSQVESPNVLLIPVDDLNDWIGCLGGHPQAQTPNIDSLAARGMLFANAHCQSPVCNPSRASMMTGLYPATSGVYFLSPDLSQSDVAKKALPLPMRYVAEGYQVAGAGKIFHGNQNKKYVPNYAGDMGGFGPMPKQRLSAYDGHRLWDWGAFPAQDAQMPDFKLSAWGAQQLELEYERPFFLAVGFFRPHVPQYAPQKWFDLYPLASLQLPKVKAGDLEDLSQYGINLTRLEHVAPQHSWVNGNDEWKPLVRSYLACVSFVDEQVGKLLRALEQSPHAENTLIVLYGDHGFHLGEKERWAKRSLWDESTRVPLIIVGPGVTKGAVCHKPVQLLDVYPTLLALTGHANDPAHEGHSLKPLIESPTAKWPHYARTSFGPGNVAIRSKRYRYIHYADGSEEFYDHADDPHEWNNRIVEPQFAGLISRHRAELPTKYHSVLGKGSTGHKSLAATEALGH